MAGHFLPVIASDCICACISACIAKALKASYLLKWLIHFLALGNVSIKDSSVQFFLYFVKLACLILDIF